ncbi:MAG: PFL family protein [Firmicutes bacterium]|nr:PFL family protein [Bacillota bacterium]
MVSKNEILQTVQMISEQHLDIRTLTLSLGLFDCISTDKKKTADMVYDKICRLGGNLVSVGEALSREYGVPIVNKRIAVTPIAMIGASSGGYIELAKALDKSAKEIGIDFIGGYSALVQKDFCEKEKQFLLSIPEALSSTNKVCGSVAVASTRAGINMDAVALMGDIIKDLAKKTAKDGGIGCAKLVVFCNAVEDNPFMAGAFTGVGEGDAALNVGVSGPGVVEKAVKAYPSADFATLAEVIKKTAFKITRAGELIGRQAAKRLGVKFGILDLSLAPTPLEGDSVASILEEFGLERVGTHGTTAALAMLNDAVKKGGIMASGSCGGLSGAFIPVSEDAGMIRSAKEGILTIDKLEAMTSVCSVGLDMIAVPGDTPASTISAIIADECAIGMINNKTTAVRIIPAPNKEVGDEVEFGGLLGTAPIMSVHKSSSEKFIKRGGRIPAPCHSYKN